MKRILISVSLVVLVLLVAEGGARLLIPVDPVPAPLLCRFHPILGWKPEPGRVEEWRPPGGELVVLAVDAQGLRGEVAPAAKGDQERRILALGDAATLGSTVAAGEAYPQRLAELLGGRGLEARALNAGVDCYTLDQQLIWFRRNAPALRPDLVLVGFTREGLHRLVRDRHGRFPKPRFRLDENGRLVPPELPLAEPEENPLRRLVEGIRLTRLLAPPVGPRLAPPAPSIPAAYGAYLVEVPEETRESWNLLRALLAELGAEAKKSQALLLAFAIPDHAQVQGEETHRILDRIGIGLEQWNLDRPTAFFSGSARELGIATLDLLGFFRGAEREGRRLFFPGETGLRPAGHRLVAERLERRLQELGWYGLK